MSTIRTKLVGYSSDAIVLQQHCHKVTSFVDVWDKNTINLLVPCVASTNILRIRKECARSYLEFHYDRLRIDKALGDV